MSSRHRETIARRTLAFARLLFLQRQAISVSASGAGRKPVESFQSLALLHANPAFPQRPTQTRLGKSLSSDVTSTTAARSRSSQLSPPEGTVSGVRVISRLRIQNSVYLWSHSQRLSI